MKTIQDLQALTNTITDKDKLDKVFEVILYPRLEQAAKIKSSELRVTDNCYDFNLGVKLEKIMGRKVSLQTLIETTMKPYLTEKGFKVSICSPNYMVYVRW